MRIGFTGTRHGMSKTQFNKVAELLATFITDGPSTFNHGQCIGSDCEAASLAYSLGYVVIAHPGYSPKYPNWRGSRGSFDQNNIILPEKPFLDRDHDIVNESDVVVATPNQKEEQRRSGTWATIRYARKTSLVIIVFPDGSVSIEEG
jgi:hypothetical protein